LGKGSGDGRNIGKLPQTHKPKNQRIILIIMDLPETSEAEQKINNEQQYNQMAPKDSGDL
jgi:hypothetical protein